MIRIAPLAVLGALVAGPEVQAAGSSPLTADDRVLLKSYAESTWRSIDKASRDSALPSDGIWRAGTSWSALAYTSPTDIGAYLWSTIAAEGLGLIPHEDASRRLANTLSTVGRLERSHGFFYNWYDPKTGERLRNWPGGGPVRGFLSTVDNAWLAVALMMVGKAHPELKASAEALLQPMDFGFFYDPLDPAHPDTHPGLLRGGFFPDGGGVFADFHYGMLNTEPRIASYVGIARGQIPADHYYRMHRAAPEASAPTRTYRGVPVVEAWQPYKGARLLPSWDGTMFEALMVPLFVPEATWGPSSWGTNHRLYAEAQIEYGLNDAHLGYWGISASTDAKGGYHAFGVGALGTSPTAGRDARGETSRVVTPHASFLALPFAPRQSMDNLKKLAQSFPSVYTPYGFLDAVDVGTGQVSDGVLVLDQGMILAAIANTLDQESMQQAFSGSIEMAIRPLIEEEQFEVRPSAVLSNGLRTVVAVSPAATASPAPALAPARVAEVGFAGPSLAAAGPEELAPSRRNDGRMGALGPKRTPTRRRTGKSADRRRTA